jgi:hypothetical protein
MWASNGALTVVRSRSSSACRTAARADSTRASAVASWGRRSTRSAFSAPICSPSSSKSCCATRWRPRSQFQVCLRLAQLAAALVEGVAEVGGIDANQDLAAVDEAAGCEGGHPFQDLAADLRAQHDVAHWLDRSHGRDLRTEIAALGLDHIDQHGGLAAGAGALRGGLGAEDQRHDADRGEQHHPTDDDGGPSVH